MSHYTCYFICIHLHIQKHPSYDCKAKQVAECSVALVNIGRCPFMSRRIRVHANLYNSDYQLLGKKDDSVLLYSLMKYILLFHSLLACYCYPVCTMLCTFSLPVIVHVYFLVAAFIAVKITLYKRIQYDD